MLQYDDATLGNDKLEFRKVHSLSQITKARLEDIDLLPVAANADERYIETIKSCCLFVL